MSVGSRKALRDLRREKAQLLYLIAGVQTVPARAPFRNDRPVPLLPVANRRDRNSQQSSHGPEAVDAATLATFISHGKGS